MKVLDFGLAKAMDPPAPGYVAKAVVDVPDPDDARDDGRAGMILGTAAYMSPEQAKGRAADARSDIWAFGCVLYEMLARRPPFAGDTVVEILGAIVTSEPDWSALPPTTPPAVVSLLKRCLQKGSQQADARHRGREIPDRGDCRARPAGPVVSAVPPRKSPNDSCGSPSRSRSLAP